MKSYAVLGSIIRHGEQYAEDSAGDLAYVGKTLKSICVYAGYESVNVDYVTAQEVRGLELAKETFERRTNLNEPGVT